MEFSNVCLFRHHLSNCSYSKELVESELSDKCREKVILASIQRKDTLSAEISSFDSFKYHKQCYLDYTSTDKIKRHLKRKGVSTEQSSQQLKSPRR